MSAESAVATRSWSVGGYQCTLTVRRPKPGAVCMAVCEWTPSEPAQLTTAEWREYTAGRNHAIGLIAEALGLSTGVISP